MKFNATAREKEVRKFPGWFIDSVKFPDEHELQLNREMYDAFRVYFRDLFARCPDLALQEFRSYLANIPRLGAMEAEMCAVYIFILILYRLAVFSLPRARQLARPRSRNPAT